MALPRPGGPTTLILASALALAGCADEPLPDISGRPPDAPAAEAPAVSADTAPADEAEAEAELSRANPRELARRFRTSVDRAVAAGEPGVAMAEIRRMEQYLAELSDEEAARFVSTWESPSFQEWLASTMRTLQTRGGPGGERRGSGLR